MVARTEPAQQRDGAEIDDFRDLDAWTARIRRAAGPPTEVELLQLRMLIARHTGPAREILAELDSRRT